MASVSKQSNLSLAEPVERKSLRENPIMLVSLQGQNLGKYRVLEPLGRGGMAQVYRAYHPQLNRYVAIKVLRSDLIEEEEFLNRFRREAQSVANLRHPNIVQIYDFDVQEDVYFMVMELLEGDTLKAQLRNRQGDNDQLPWGDSIRILLDVLQGLEYAHGEGIIHRDIKPANIMLTSRGQAVVTDFGIAQIIGSTQYTGSGALMGTLSYMAPEQGLEGRASVQSDLYSLGIVLYEMLTGQPPFDADTPLAILMKHVNDPLPLPRTINPAIPEAFERLVLKALCKQPEERYQSAAEMATAIAEVAKEARITVPKSISLPKITTKESEQEAAAVFSGPEREHITDAGFVSDDTEMNLDDKVAKSPSSEKTPAKAERHALEKSSISTILPAGLALVGFNLMAVFLGIVSGNWRLFKVGWPAEIILVSLVLCFVMANSGYPFLLIPIGILLGNGLLLAFYSLTGFWNFWRFLWPLEPLLVIGVVVVFLLVNSRKEDRQILTIQIAKRLTQLAFVVLVITVAISAIPIR